MAGDRAGNVARVPVPLSRPAWVARLDELHLLTPARIVAILLVAWLLTVVMKRLVARLMAKLLGVAGRRAVEERSSARSRSLSSALRSATLATIWFVASITVLGELGVNLSGVVVTATVVGGALAFGAQTLVRDVITGVFVLSEDQYAVGDVIDVGVIGGGTEPIVGTVERVTLRSTRLHDAAGRIWHVPNGAVLRVANLSKASVAVLDAAVERNVDLEAVRREIQRLFEALGAHDRVGPLTLGPPTGQGIAELLDDRIVLRATVPTIPGRQAEVEQVWRELLIGAYRAGRLDAPGP